MTKIVVIGRTGQVAMELQRTELPQGWSLMAIGRDRLDLNRLEGIPAILDREQPDAIVNTAAYTAVDRAEMEEEQAFQINAAAPGEMAIAAHRLGIPFLHFSTDYVFDGKPGRPWREDDAAEPLNAYGRSKLAGERAVLDKGARAIVFRTSWVFSPFGNNFLKTMLRLGSERQELNVIADQRGGPTAASDIATAVLGMLGTLLISPTRPAAGIYHFCGTPETCWADLAAAIFREAIWLPVPPKINRISSAEYESRAVRPLNSVLDCSKISRDFGIAQPDWRIGLSRALSILKPSQSEREQQ